MQLRVSWYTTSKTLKVGKTRLATHKSYVIASLHRPNFFIYAPHLSVFTIRLCTKTNIATNYKDSPFDSLHFPPLKKCVVHVVGILNLFSHVFVGIHENINNNQEDLKHKIFNRFNCKNIAHKSIQPETCFGKHWGYMSPGCPHLALTLVVWKMCRSRK